jgi:methylenetetrahydrofolate dehydrogenase (NADP+)/methenyltetrahydrofolate cyclohydrolase
MVATLIDGKRIAASLRGAVARKIAERCLQGLRTPGLAVVLVGNDPASEVYVRSKSKLSAEVGIASFQHSLPYSTTEDELLDLVASLNADDSVDGILVQLPLPPAIDSGRVLQAVDPTKDVDGFHPINVGKLAIGEQAFVPCTPLGCLRMLDSICSDLSGQSAVVIGRSTIVGKPMAQLLLSRNCTVTIAHSRSRDLPEICRRADILVAAVGRPEMVRGDWIKPGAIVLDVGINRIDPGGTDTRKLVGDVAFSEALQVAGAITPVPGGVGPMTIACLLENTLTSAEWRHRQGSARAFLQLKGSLIN